jgi:hypothetical protein
MFNRSEFEATKQQHLTEMFKEEGVKRHVPDLLTDIDSYGYAYQQT